MFALYRKHGIRLVCELHLYKLQSSPTLQLDIQLFSHSSLICSKAFGLYYLQNFGVATTISTRTDVHMSMLHCNFTRLDHQTSLFYVQCLHIKTMPLQIWRTPLLTFHVHNRTNGIQHIATLMKFPILAVPYKHYSQTKISCARFKANL